METNAPWITCRAGKKVCLFAGDEKAYYIIEVGKKLDYATEEWLESQGVSEELLKELQLPFTYIPKAALRGVAIGGNHAGDEITLYLKSEKQRLVLELDYDQEWLISFFQGISRFTPPETKKNGKKKANADGDSWRREKRDPVLYKKLWWVPLVLGGVSLLAVYGFYLTRHPAWFTLYLVLLAVPLLLDILMPAYFTIFFTEKNKKRDAISLEAPLLISMLGIVFCGRVNWIEGTPFWQILVICAVGSVLICLLAEEFRWEPIWLLAALFFGGCFGTIAVGRANEVYAPQEPQSYILVVEDTRYSGGKSKSYYCTVTLPDGREMELHISRNHYYDLETGDYVRVEHGEGFFGVEYANAYPYQEGE